MVKQQDRSNALDVVSMATGLEAVAKGSAAAEAAAAAEREVLDVAPIEVEHAPPSTTAATRRYALLQNTCLAKTYCCLFDNMSCIQ